MRHFRDVFLAVLLVTNPMAVAQEDVPEVARQKLQEATRHRESGRIDEAIARYREVIETAPSLLDAYVGLGAIYHQQENYQSALEVFAAGIQRFPQDATLLFNVAATESRLERFEDALRHCDQALRITAADPALHSLRGTILRRLGRQEEAIQSLRKVAELDSRSARAHYNLGNVLYELGRKEEALDSFRQAIQLDKEFQPAHYNMGAVLFELERFDEALRAYEVALEPVEKDFAKGREVSPAHARAYSNLGAIFLKRQSWDRALDAYQKASRLDPSLAAAHYNVGYIRYRMGQEAEAYSAYERAVSLDAELPLSYLHMGLMDFEAGRMEKAVRWLEQGLPRFAGEDRERALLALGASHRSLGDRARAEQAYRSVLQSSPQEVNALVGLGRLLREQGKMAEARPLLERAGGIVLDSSGVALELAALARAEGDAARERLMYEEALRRDGDREEMWPVRVNLVAAMVRSGDVGAARREMEALMKQLPAIERSSPAVSRQLRTAHALLAAREGKLDAARRELEVVLRDDPGFVPAANAAAALEAAAGRLKQASRDWSGLLSRPGGESIEILVRANLGQALWLDGRFDDAREHLLAAAEAFPDNLLLLTALGEIELGRGDHAAAVRELRAAVGLCGSGAKPAPKAAPSTRLELVLFGEALSESGCARSRRALALALVASAGEKLTDPGARREVSRLAEEAVALGIEGASLARALFLRGTVALFEGQDAKARADLERSLAGGLEEALAGAARNNLGVALYRSGQIAEAERQFELARRSSPGTAPAVLNLAIVKHEGREPEQALSLYDEYLTLGGRRSEDARAWAEGIRSLYR